MKCDYLSAYAFVSYLILGLIDTK